MFWSVRALAAEIMGAYSDVSSAALRSPGGRDQEETGRRWISVVNCRENGDWSNKNGDFRIENADLSGKHGDLTMEHGDLRWFKDGIWL